VQCRSEKWIGWNH